MEIEGNPKFGKKIALVTGGVRNSKSNGGGYGNQFEFYRESCHIHNAIFNLLKIK